MSPNKTAVPEFPRFDVIDATLQVLKNHPFVSKGQAYKMNNMPSATAFKVQSTLAENEQLGWFNQEKSTAILKWVTEDFNPISDFDKTIHATFQQDRITAKQLGTAVCVVVAYTKAMKFAEESKEHANSAWLGTLDKRDEFFVKLLKVSFIENYGSYIYQVITREGNVGNFWSNKELQLCQNDCFLMKATPKQHNLNKYSQNKETKFNRVKVIENMGTK